MNALLDAHKAALAGAPTTRTVDRDELLRRVQTFQEFGWKAEDMIFLLSDLRALDDPEVNPILAQLEAAHGGGA